MIIFFYRNWRSRGGVQTVQHPWRRTRGIGQRKKTATGERAAGGRGREVEEAVIEWRVARRGWLRGCRDGRGGPLCRPRNGTATREGGTAGAEG